MNFRRSFVLGLVIFSSIFNIFAEIPVSEERQKFIDAGLEYQGVPYVYGGKNPATGLDCSGFVAYAAKVALDKNIFNSAAGMYESVEHIDESIKEPGDLIFFAVKEGDGYRVSHVGIYLGIYHGEGKLNGERIFLHSASDGRHTGVIVSSINDNYWKKYFWGYGRILPPTDQGTSSDNTRDSKGAEGEGLDTDL